jgi:hypothetical protein
MEKHPQEFTIRFKNDPTLSTLNNHLSWLKESRNMSNNEVTKQIIKKSISPIVSKTCS